MRFIPSSADQLSSWLIVATIVLTESLLRKMSPILSKSPLNRASWTDGSLLTFGRGLVSPTGLWLAAVVCLCLYKPRLRSSKSCNSLRNLSDRNVEETLKVSRNMVRRAFTVTNPEAGYSLDDPRRHTWAETNIHTRFQVIFKHGHKTKHSAAHWVSLVCGVMFVI